MTEPEAPAMAAPADPLGAAGRATAQPTAAAERATAQLAAAAEKTTAADLAPLLERVFAVPREASYAIEEIEGELPAELAGVYYLNGPARFTRGDFAYRHWLDGDGMVCALRFGNGGAHFTCRFVRTAKLVDEEAAGRPLYRTFGTAFAGDRLLRGVGLASPANVSVYPFAGTLLAFGEQGLPYELDPETLATRGEYNFGGGVNPVSPLAAHAKVDPSTGEMIDFGISFSAAQPLIHLYRFDPRGRRAERRRVPLDLPATMHDFALAPRHAVFYVSPYLVGIEGLLQRGACLMDCLSWQPERGSRLLIVEREGGGVLSLPIGSGYCLHLANAFEEERGRRLVVDVVELEEPVYDEYQPVPDLFREVTGARPVRYEVDLAKREIAARREIPFELAADFPAIDPRRTGRRAEHLWMLAISATGRPGRKFLDRLVRYDWELGHAADAWQAPPGCYLGGEPAFAPEPGAGRCGWVIVQQLDAARGEGSFLVFDAFHLAQGPVARLRLTEPIHLGFHACFQPAWDGDRTEKLWK